MTSASPVQDNPRITADESPNRNEPFKILSWNIQDGMTSSEGPKTDNTIFCGILRKSTIFCLQETKMEINLPEYKCTTQLRKGSRSGGTCIGIHKSIADRFINLKTGCQDIQAITTKMCSSTDNMPLTIINVYDSDERSAYKARKKAIRDDNIPTLELLMGFTAKNKLGKILLAGDFNARTKNLNHEITDTEDESSRNHRSEPAEITRMSKDSCINKRGRLFLDFIASSNITILNGNTVGDILGELTSVNYRGCSVVDYMAAS